MKIKYLIIAGLILAIITMGAVSAADDNATSELAADEDLNLESSIDEVDLAADGDSQGTFSELSGLIDSYEGDTLELDRDYQYEYSSKKYTFNRNEIVIDGKGHNIDFKNSDAHFEFRPDGFLEVTLKNINFYNSTKQSHDSSYAADGNAALNFIVGEISIINCTFHNFSDAVFLHGSRVNVIDCSFYGLDGTAICDDWTYYGRSNVNITGSNFINCNSQDNVIVSNLVGVADCRFVNCTGGEIFGSRSSLSRFENCSFVDCYYPIMTLRVYLSFEDNIAVGEVATIDLEVNANINATANVTINGDPYPVDIINGWGQLNLTDLALGDYEVDLIFDDDEYFEYYWYDLGSFSVLNNPNLKVTTDGCADGKIVFHVTMNEDISDQLSYEVTYCEWNEWYMAYETYTIDYSDFNVMGGEANVTLTDLEPREYEITFRYSGDADYAQREKTLSFNFTSAKAGDDSSSGKTDVQPSSTPQASSTDAAASTAPAATSTPTSQPASKTTLTLKKVTVKKSAKKLVLTATLKVNGKAVKGKTIKFKFNGKTYKAKTNKKGVAKATIKKAVLKKLKAGKKITYQASYGKTIVKRSVVVKK